MDVETLCIVCNWVNDAFWPWGPFGAFGAAAAGFFGGGGFSGGSSGGESNQDAPDQDDSFDESEHSRNPRQPWNDPTRNQANRRAQEEYQETLRHDRDVRRDNDIREARERFNEDPSYVNGVRWFQEWFDFEANNVGTVPSGGKA